MTLPPDYQDDAPQEKTTLRGVIRNTLIAYGLFVLIPLIVGLVVAINGGDNAAQTVVYLRDLLWVIILLLTIPVLVGASLLLIQLAALFGVIRLDISGLFAEMRGAFQAVSGTARFVGETVARPIIRVWTFFSGGWAFSRELARLFAAIRRRPNPESDESTPQE